MDNASTLSILETSWEEGSNSTTGSSTDSHGLSEASTTLTTLMEGMAAQSGDDGHLSMEVVIVLSVLVAVIIMLTVVGNLLVIVAFTITSTLRTYNNYFILGLAVADLVVGAVDMPLFAIIFLLGRWPFGEVFCDIFSFLDHAFAHVSILLVMLISLDRCVAVSFPIRHHKSWKRRSRALQLVATGYLIPLVLWLPLTTLWQVVNGKVERPIPPDVCQPLYIESVIASFAIPAIYFVVPFIVTAILCLRIVFVIKRVHRERRKLRMAANRMMITIVEAPTTDGETAIDGADNMGSNCTREDGDTMDRNTKTGPNPSRQQEDKNHIGKESMKGIRTLAFIVTAMMVAWLPSVLVTVTSSICPSCVPGVVYSVVVFWGYTNSMMNPICYALSDAAFKDAFTRILSMGRYQKDSNPATESSTY